MSTDTTIAQLVIDGLRHSEIDTLYCLPGVQNDDFFNVLVDAPDIRPVVCRHEQGAAYMAMGAAQATGKPAAFCVVPGPGILNASAALTSAYWAYSRVLGIVGQIASFQKGKHYGVLHDLPDQTAILSQLAKHNCVADPGNAQNQLQDAFEALHSGLARPVTIEVPADYWVAPTSGSLTKPIPQTSEPDSAQIEAAAKAIAQAKNPIIVVGSGAYEAGEQVTALAELLQCPVTTRRMGHGVVPTDHELFVPLTVAHRMWKEIDVAIGIGTRMEWPLLSWGIDDDLTVVQVNLDADELDRHNIGAVGVLADARLGTQALLDALGDSLNHGRSPASDLAKRTQDFLEETAHIEPQRSILGAIRDVLPDDGVIVEDVTQIGFAAHLWYDHRKPRTFLSSGAAGTLGAAPAITIGAADATDRAVIGVIGDGGFLFTATELATAVQHDIPANLVVFNNNAYGNVRRIQRNRFGADRVIASALDNPDFSLFAKSFGVKYFNPQTPADLQRDLGAAIEFDGPTLVEMPMEHPSPDPWPYMRMPRQRGTSRKNP